MIVTHQQTYVNSCGAACLLCAAVELGVSLFNDADGNSTQLSLNNYHEKKIYEVTSISRGGIIDLGVVPRPNPTDPNTWGYNMPSYIVECAERLNNLPALVVSNTQRITSMLKRNFSDEYSTRLMGLKRLGKFQEDGPLVFLAEPLRELKVLISHSGGMHYVMVRPGGSVMEPGRGVNYTCIAMAKAALNMYSTGLSVFIGWR